MLEVKELTVRYGALTIVDDVSFTVNEGEWLMLAGPNGAGKSTIVGALTRGVPCLGSIELLGQSVASFSAGAFANLVGVLAQEHYVGYAFTVEEVVRLGRYAHSGGALGSGDTGGEAAVEKALALTGMDGLRTHSVLTLSGGELQRTFLAQVLCQEPRLLILDEPTNHLDLVYQKQVFSLISEWLKQGGRAVISVVHDLSLARAYGTHALLLSQGKLVGCGKVSDVLTRENLDRVYSMDVYGWMQEMLAQWK